MPLRRRAQSLSQTNCLHKLPSYTSTRSNQTFNDAVANRDGGLGQIFLEERVGCFLNTRSSECFNEGGIMNRATRAIMVLLFFVCPFESGVFAQSNCPSGIQIYVNSGNEMVSL